jgi:hypothetical protein
VTDRVLVVTLLAVGLVARVSVALATGNSFQFPDEAEYTDAAYRLIAGGGFGADYARVPAYPVFLAALVGPMPASVLLVRVIQAVVTTFGAGVLYALASLAIGRGPAFAAVLFYIFDPLLVVAGGLLYPEAIAAVLMTAVALVAILAAREDQLGLTALSGLLLGVLVQLRPVALTLVPVLTVWISASTPGQRSSRLLHAGVVILVCLLSLLPWTYRNYRVHGRLMPITTVGTGSTVASNPEVARRGLTAAIVQKAWTDPGGFAVRVGREFVHFWEFYPTRLASDDPRRRTYMKVREPRLSAAPMFDQGLRDTLSAISFACEIILAMLGVTLAWKTHRRETVLMVMLILAFALGYTMFVAKLRYRIPVLPLLFVFAGVGAHALWEAIRARGSRRWSS